MFNTMKKRLFYILLSISAVATGCIKDDGDATPVVQPTGKFAGQFIRIHTNKQSLAKDTIRVSVQLELVNNTFKIVGCHTILSSGICIFERFCFKR